MHMHGSWLAALVLSVSSATACWAQTPEPSLAGIRDLRTALALIGREWCDQVSPGFRAATTAGYDRWRRENAAAIAAVEASPEFQAVLAHSRTCTNSLSDKELRDTKTLCAYLRDTSEVRPRDPRLTTPITTWELFVASLKAADRLTASQCLTGTARSKFGDVIDTLPDDGLRQMGSAMRDFKMTNTLRGGLQEGFAVRQDGQGGFIYFDERNGEWRLSEM